VRETLEIRALFGLHILLPIMKIAAQTRNTELYRKELNTYLERARQLASSPAQMSNAELPQNPPPEQFLAIED